MLAQTIVLLAFLAVFAASATFAVAGYARARVAVAAKALVVPAVEQALAGYEAAIGTNVRAQIPLAGVPLEPPAAIPILSGESTLPDGSAAFPTVTQLLAPDATSALRVAVTIEPTTTSFPACAPVGGAVNGGADQELQAQCSPFVQESRLSLAVTSDAGPPDGAGGVVSLAHDRYTVTLRLFAQPPYVLLAGALDAADRAAPHEADLGGWDGDLGALAPPGPSADDTTIHVQFACVPAAGTCAATLPHGPDDVQTRSWSNGNGAP